MRTSNSYFALMLTLSLVLVLTGCHLPKPQEKPNASGEANVSATFKAKAVADRSKAVEVQVEGPFALPSAKVFNLMACLKDVAYDKPIQGHQFRVEETDTLVTSDKEGCVTWAERIDFNYLAESKYIRLDRTLRGEKLHKGLQKVAYAVNPWSHGETLPAVLNPDDGNKIPGLVEDEMQIQQALKGLSTSSSPIRRPLWVDEGRFFVTEQRMTHNNITLSFEIHPKVNLQLTKMNGDLFSRPLTAGTFRARMKLIHVYQKEKEIHRLISQTGDLQTSIVNGNLSIKTPMSLPALPTRGQFFLGLELEPLNAPAGMTGFVGVYYLSEYDQLKGSGFLKLSPLVSQDPHFSLESFINADVKEVLATDKTISVADGKKGEEVIPGATAPTSRINDLDVDIYQKPKIQVLKLDFDYLRVGLERTSTRQIFYTIRACFRHGLDQKTVRSQTIKVTKFRASDKDPVIVTEKTLDPNSCIIWDENITFDYFACHHYIPGAIQLENADMGIKETIQVLINPWESAGGALGRDMRYVDPKEKLPLRCDIEERPRTQVALDGFSYNTVSYEYKIDKLMNMTMFKTINIRADARMLVYSSLTNGRGDLQRLRDGVYLLRTAIVKNQKYDDSKNTFVAGDEKLVNVISGQIIADLTFATSDIKALGNRNTLLMEIYPIDDSKVTVEKNRIRAKDPAASLSSLIDRRSELQTPTFVGHIILNVDEASRNLRILDGSALSEFYVHGKGSNNTAVTNIIENILEQGKKDLAAHGQKLAQRAGKDIFIKENNVALLNLNKADNEAPLKALVGESDLDKRLIVTKADLKAFLDSGVVTPELAQKLCAFWGRNFWTKMHGTKGGVLMGPMNNFGLSCYQAAGKEPQKFFVADRQMFIKDIAGSRYVGGVNQGYSIGTSFSSSVAHSTYTTRSWAFNTKMGISKKFFDLFSMGADYGYTISWATSDAQSVSDALSLNGQKSLSVQTNTYQVRVNRYEQCAVVRLNPALFVKDTTSWFGSKDYLGFLNPRLNEQELAQAITRGVMICDGEDRTKAVTINENYFFISQPPGETHQQDMGDERNRKFVVALRSTPDFKGFIAAIRGHLKEEAPAEKDSVESAAVETLFQNPGPIYPGMYRN